MPLDPSAGATAEDDACESKQAITWVYKSLVQACETDAARTFLTTRRRQSAPMTKCK